MLEDPFAPFHRDAAPTDEPLPEVPDEPDGFEAHLFNRLGTVGVLKAMAGDTSSVVGVLTVGRDWCRWDPPGGREATHIDLAHIEHVRLEKATFSPKNNQKAQLVFVHGEQSERPGRKQFLTTYYSSDRREKPERWLRWLCASLTARARRARGEPFDEGSELERDIAAARNPEGHPSGGRASPMQIVDESHDGLTVRVRAFAPQPFFGCIGAVLIGFVAFGPLPALGALIHPALATIAFFAGLAMAVLVFVGSQILARSHVTIALDATGVTVQRNGEQRFLWSELDSVEVGQRSAYRVNKRGKLPLVLTTTDGRRVEVPIAYGRGCVDERHIGWLADQMAEMILARAGGRAPEALTALRANRPPELEG
jgi:hypothetical protein